ncbi:MAG TPA: hypothetical protein VK657_08130, partial [Terriglobales bacterium]|nr:hypothetical protein [Terriglobales bacterium]
CEIISTIDILFRKGGRNYMAITETADRTMATHEEMAKTVATGAGAEAVAGGAAVILAIIGLAGLFPMILASIAVIAAGAAFLFEGAAVAARYRRLAAEAGGGEAEIETGMSAEIIGGLAGIALGILALIGVETVALLAVSVIVFGGTLLFGSPAVYRASRAEPGNQIVDAMARQMTAGAAGAQALVGIAAITLGILALVGIVPQTLVLVSVLCIGGAALLSGGALTSKMVSLLYH